MRKSAQPASWFAERTDDDPQLGVLTSAESFRGWRPLVLEQELGRMFGFSELRPLNDIGRVRWVQLKPNVPYDPPANCVFVPTLGFGDVRTAPPDLEGKRGYMLLEVELDPEVAQAEYVAGLLSSRPGRQLRESVSTGSGRQHLSATGAEVIRLPVPPISDQLQTVRSAAHLASMEATVARLRDELWRRPQNAARVLTELESGARADPVLRWLETLPYPLASVLQRFSARRDPRERLEALLHFYEATACPGRMSCWRPSCMCRGRSRFLCRVRPGDGEVVLVLDDVRCSWPRATWTLRSGSGGRRQRDHSPGGRDAGHHLRRDRAAISVLVTLQSAHTLYLTLYIWNRPPSEARAGALLATSLVLHRHAPGAARGIGDPDDGRPGQPGGRLTLSLGAGFPFPRTKTQYAAPGVPFAERIGCLLETVQLWRLLVSGTPPDMFRGRYRTARTRWPPDL